MRFTFAATYAAVTLCRGNGHDEAERSHHTAKHSRPECIAPLAVSARVGLPEIQGGSVRYQSACGLGQ